MALSLQSPLHSCCLDGVQSVSRVNVSTTVLMPSSAYIVLFPVFLEVPPFLSSLKGSMYSESQETFLQGQSITSTPHPHPSLLGMCGAWEILRVTHSFSEIGPNPASRHPPLRWTLLLQKLGLLKADTELFHVISAPKWIIHPSY